VQSWAKPVGRRIRAGRSGFTIIELLSVMAVIGVLSATAIPKLGGNITKARVANAISDLRAISIDIASQDSVPPSLAAIGRGAMLDPWGRPYVFVKFPPGPPPGSARVDLFGVPVNSKFDLYSLGPDGATATGLSAVPSLDDVVVANDGGYLGVGAKF
jgi:general secretion pathway protein G